MNQSLKQRTKNNNIPDVRRLSSAMLVLPHCRVQMEKHLKAQSMFVAWLNRLHAHHAHNSDRRSKTATMKFSVLFDAASPQIPPGGNSKTACQQDSHITPKWFVRSKSKATVVLSVSPMSRLNKGNFSNRLCQQHPFRW